MRISENVKKFMKETGARITEEKIEPINEKAALKNSLFPTLAKRAIRKN
jgi:hypothetical protein